MNKLEAKNLVLKTFEKPFDETQFIRFIKDLLNNLDESKRKDYRGNIIPDSFDESIRQYKRIGQYTDPKNNVIDVLVVELKRDTSIERARTLQRNFVARHLKKRNHEAALVAYFTKDFLDWRFSFVKLEYNLLKKDDGKVKIAEVLSPAKRYSFLVGANERSHTAQSQFQKILTEIPNPSLDELEQAFNIERVTREFFEKYRTLFITTKQALDKVIDDDSKIKNEFKAKDVNSVDFSKKLLGQIVFLYFLQKKGWFGVPKDAQWGQGSKQFLREIFEQKHKTYNNFFDEILEPLFYDALRNDRSHDYHYYPYLKCKIPFLNGGLFDPIGNYDWVHTDINLPNELFSNNHETKEGDIGDGILDIFDRYNFTVIEDEPLEKEIAIDPELLGKTYEKFNAIRPDNFNEYIKVLKSGKKGEENKFNKQYGVYYTPREIVHYMCRESLINYLVSEFSNKPASYEKLGDSQIDAFGNITRKGQLALEKVSPLGGDLEGAIPKEDIETLINYGEFLGENEAVVESKGKETETYYHKLPESIRKNAKLIDEKLVDILICDPAVGSGAFPVGMMHEIVGARNLLSIFIKESGRSIYNFKRECIEKSLYGVDIDSGAVEIAKLRLWLSLVVDEDNFKEIKPLPNLDYKIVCGNSLIGVEKNIFNNEYFEQLEKIKPLHFNETNPTKKEEYKNQIDELILKLSNGHKDFDFEVYFSEVFHQKKGFDVVIGNPPYIKEYTYRNAFNGIRESPYYMGKMDIWYMFACIGIDFLRNKGNLCFIAQNNWVTSYGAKKMREKILKDSQIVQLIDFGDYKIFENADIQTMIMIFKKINVDNEYHFDLRRLIGKNTTFNDVLDLLIKNKTDILEYLSPKISYKNLKNKPLTFNDILAENVLNKIKAKQNFKLSENDEVAQGVVAPQEFLNNQNRLFLGDGYTEGEGIFVLNDQELKQMNLNKSELSLIKPFYTTEQLTRFFGLNKNNSWLIYTDSSFKYPETIKPYPNIKKHLDRFFPIITSDNKPYGLHRSRYENFFKGEKILSLRKCLIPTFTYTNFDCYVSQTFFIIKSKRINLKYLIGIFNSRLIAFWLKHKGKMQGSNYQVDKEPLLDIPIYKSEKPEPLIRLVDQILNAKQQNPKANTKELEDQIDIMVYKLYNLSYEEVKIIDPEINKIISEKEYEKFEIK
ncbi:MAG: hypothetical protein STSR0008_21870 [Ignavibacterium sp.]